jgi:hypothetical protein
MHSTKARRETTRAEDRPFRHRSIVNRSARSGPIVHFENIALHALSTVGSTGVASMASRAHGSITRA